MVGQLDLERSLHQPLGQLGQRTIAPDDLLLGARAGQHVVHHLVRELASHVVDTLSWIPGA
jgi:hypothetical protein